MGGTTNTGHFICRYRTFSFICSVMHDRNFQDEDCPALFDVPKEYIAFCLLIMLCIDYSSIGHSFVQYTYLYKYPLFSVSTVWSVFTLSKLTRQFYPPH